LENIQDQAILFSTNPKVRNSKQLIAGNKNTCTAGPRARAVGVFSLINQA